MSRRASLPASIERAFTLEEARLADVPAGRMRARDLERPSVGVRMRSGATLLEILRAVVRTLPRNAFLCGATAAWAHGAPLPRRLDIDETINIGVARGERAIRRVGAVGRTLDVREQDVETRGDLRLTTPQRTWLDLARVLDLEHLVAAGDYFAHASGEFALPLTAFAEIVAANRGVPGVALAREAAPLVSDAAESPAESRLRVVLYLAGLPKAEVNVSIFDGRRFVARVDLLLREFGIVIEYEGAHHGADPHQWKRDMTRIGMVQTLGYVVERVHADDLHNPVPLLRRLERHLRARGWAGRVVLP